MPVGIFLSLFVIVDIRDVGSWPGSAVGQVAPGAAHRVHAVAAARVLHLLQRRLERPDHSQLELELGKCITGLPYMRGVWA